MPMLSATPPNVNPVPRAYRNWQARVYRTQSELRTKFNTFWSGGRKGVVGVGRFGTRYGRVRRYTTSQAFKNEMARRTERNFRDMVVGLNSAVDSLINKTWAHLEASL